MTRKDPVRNDLGTPQRRARGDVRVTGEAKSARKARAETSVERIAGQKDADGEPKLSMRQVEAAKQYYVRAVAYGVFGRYASMSLCKEVFGPTGVDDGAEWLEDRKREYIGASDCVSPRYKQAMHAIILYDQTLTEAGKLMGGKGPNAGAAAFPMLKDTLDRLADFFKITVVGDEADYEKQDKKTAA